MTDLTQQQKFERIKKISREKGMSLAQLNKKANMKDNVIYSWKSKEPSATAIKKVADALGVSVDYLLGNTDEMMPNKKDSSNTESNDVKKFFEQHEMFSYDGKPINEKDLATIKFILENGYEDK